MRSVPTSSAYRTLTADAQTEAERPWKKAAVAER